METLPIELFIKIINPEPTADVVRFMTCKSWYEIAMGEMLSIYKRNKENHIRLFSACLSEIKSIRYKLYNPNNVIKYTSIRYELYVINNSYNLTDYISVRQIKNIATTYIYKRDSCEYKQKYGEVLYIKTSHYKYHDSSNLHELSKNNQNKSKRDAIKDIFKRANCDLKYKMNFIHGIKDNTKHSFYEMYSVKTIPKILYDEYFHVIKR